MASDNYYNDPLDNPNTAIHDLGAERFDHDVAAAGDRDYALRSQGVVRIAKGRADKGLEAQVFAWNTMQYTTEDKDEVAELKGDLHGGQLHRQNRVASGNGGPGGYSAGGLENFSGGGGRGGFGGRGNRGGRGGRGGGGAGRKPGQKAEEYEELRAGMKPTDREVPPLMKGFAEELTADMFWNEPLFKD